MQNILDRLKSGEVLVCDGAMGTFLQAKGLETGSCPELWCIERPEDVKDIHRQYKDAGSDLVECNSFGGTRYKLAHYGLEDRAAEINRAAAAVAREVAGDDQHVLASAGPTGEFLQPYGMATEEEFYEAFKTQMVAFEEGGADCVIVETMTSAEEASVAVKAARENTQLTVIASFTFDPQAQEGKYATMMGVTPDAFAAALKDAGAHILGSNCGTGPDHMLNIIAQIRAAEPDLPLMAMPNAGMPVIENGETVFKETPGEMAGKAPLLREAGASILGGCCGTTPDHIRAIRDAVK